MFSIIFCSILFSITATSAADKTYYWIPSSGAIGSSGFTANWGNCGAHPTSYRITTLSSTAFSCSSDYLTRTSSGDQFLAIFPTAYSSDTQIRGKTGATFYLSSQRSGYTATYRFDLGYARSGTFTSLGYVTQSATSTARSYTINMSSISGTAPSGSYPALKVSVTTSQGGRVYLGTNGGATGSNSGRFYVNETVTAPPAPTYNVSISASPVSADITAGSRYTYSITVNNTGNSNGNYTLNVIDSDTVNFTSSTLGTTTMQINSGGSAKTTLTVTAKAGASTGAVDYTTVTVRSVENPIYTNSTTVQTTDPPLSVGGQIIVKANRYVVLDDPNAGTAAPGFFSPSDVRGGNWGTNYWSGESTTIRASALIMSSNGSRLIGINVTFKLTNPAGSTVHTASSTTDGNGAAYYSYDLNSKNYWGNWRIDANATVGGTGIANGTSFVLYWWGCGQCHGPESPGNWGTKYTPKSYYTMGYDFHRSQNKQKHTEAMSKGNCITCHQMYDGTPVDRGYTDNTPPIYVENESSPDWHKGKVTCQGCHAGSNISTTPQGKNPDIAGCYDTPGCHPKKNTNPGRVNSTTGYVVGGNYRTAYSIIPNSADAHTVTSVKCILCHSAGHNITKPYNVSSTSNNNTENEQCWTCHTQRTTTHYGTTCVGCHSQNAHNVSISGGGPDCISCHNLGGGTKHQVDANAMTLAEHANLNSGANASGVSAANKKCWGCHQSDGNQPTDMGDKYNNPYKCYECHGPTKPYARVSSAMTISEHYKNGTDIKAGIFAIDNSASCALCHNVSEMKVAYTDNEFSELSLASHYGKNRSGTLDCKYCHQNTSTAFTVAMMKNIENDNLTNHSSSPSTPVCATCHGSGMLHNASLTKPASSNDSYCKTCHSDKNEHKTVYCTECHANNTNRSQAGREIHGIKYLQKDNTFSQGRTNAIDCTTCHQSDAVNSSLILPPPQISNPLHHSDDVNNGSKWGNYWTNSTGACLYCHNDTKHNATPLGRPLIWNQSYVLNTTIGGGTNCADCHYKGDGNYGTMTSVYTSASLGKPPEITNGSWNGKSGYYNHSLSDYTDSQCKSCHDKTGSTTVGQLMHNASIGSAGGPDCKACHDSGGSAPKLINFSVANNSAHNNLNNGASSTVGVEDKKCWACHGDGTQPVSGHPSNYRTPSPCENCHTGAGGYSAPIVEEHIQNGSDVRAAAACALCHDNTGMYLDNGGIGTVTHYLKDVTDKATTPYGHFGPIDTSKCLDCHNGLYTGNASWGSPVNITTSLKRKHTETSNAQCDSCHKDNTVSTLANVDFHNASLSNFGTNCLSCHASAG